MCKLAKILFFNILLLFHSISAQGDTLEINLQKGWNLISIPFQTEGNTAAEVFQNIAGKYRDVWEYNILDTSDPWKHFHPEFISFNDLQSIELNKGYWIYLNQNSTFVVSGNSVSEDQEVKLSEGWNLIGWPFPYEQLISEALAFLDYNMVGRFNAETQNWEYFSKQSIENGFELFEPGKAYYVYVTNQSSTVIPVDNIPPSIPQINVFTPFTSQQQETISGTKENYSSIWINNEEKVSINASKTWAATLSLTEGNNIFKISSQDYRGNKSADVSITIVLDTQPPVIEIISPLSGSTVSGDY